MEEKGPFSKVLILVRPYCWEALGSSHKHKVPKDLKDKGTHLAEESSESLLKCFRKLTHTHKEM